MKNSFYLERGPYTIAAVMNESVSDEPLVITGTLVDLFDPGLPVYGSVQIEPGHQGYYCVSAVHDIHLLFVSRVFTIPGFNNSVIIRHGNYLTVYSNLSQVYVKAGDKVRALIPENKTANEMEIANC